MAEFQPAATKSEITIDDLNRVDIRVGTILKVVPVPKSDKLLKLTVDLGSGTLSVLAGMAGERDDFQEIVGMQALFVVNLPPRSMMGETSEAMLLDVGYADGMTPVLATAARAVPNGARAG